MYTFIYITVIIRKLQRAIFFTISEPRKSFEEVHLSLYVTNTAVNIYCLKIVFHQSGTKYILFIKENYECHAFLLKVCYPLYSSVLDLV